MSSVDADLESAHFHQVEKIKTYIIENWGKNSDQFEAYRYLIDAIMSDIRKDFLTGVTFYRDAHDKLTPIENDIDYLRSLAMSCGLNANKMLAHLMRRIKLLKPMWLIDIPAWDQVDRLRTLCYSTRIENLSVECFYQHMLSWGSGIFARAADPYYQNKVMISRGNQGIGKDFFVKTICKALGPYVGTWTNSRHEKDIIEIMERSLVLNVPEFDNTHQNEIAMLKALITKYQATFRTPYARKAASIDLRTSFISSANVEYLLRDSTGNRRYLIFVILGFDLMDKFDEFDSMQILAQFKNAFEVGFKVGLEHKVAMDNYIASQTPPTVETQILDFWNDEFKDYLRLSNQTNADWLPARQVAPILERVRKEFGLGRNHITLLLSNRGLRKRKTNGLFYCCQYALTIAK